MAAFEVIALDTATPQLRAPGASDTYTFPRAVEMPLGTANGVLYLNGSKVVTSGSALQFSGTALTVNLDGTSLVVGTGGASTTAASFRSTTRNQLRFPSGASFEWHEGVNELMRLNSTGLGIGTTNPTQKLFIDGGASGTVTNVQVGNAATAFQLGVDGSNSCQIRTAQSVPILFYTAASERVRIKSTGQLRFVPLAADPAGAEAGDVYYNSGTNKLRLYDGSTWVDLN